MWNGRFRKQKQAAFAKPPFLSLSDQSKVSLSRKQASKLVQVCQLSKLSVAEMSWIFYEIRLYSFSLGRFLVALGNWQSWISVLRVVYGSSKFSDKSEIRIDRSDLPAQIQILQSKNTWIRLGPISNFRLWISPNSEPSRAFVSSGNRERRRRKEIEISAFNGKFTPT